MSGGRLAGGQAGPFQIVAPAGPITERQLRAGLSTLDALGLAARWDAATVFARQGYLAGSDRDRADALLDALLARPAGVWMARGGYGSLRTLVALGDALDQAPPTPLWAFSDGTALLAAWQARGWAAWHAPPISQLPRLDAASHDRLRAAALTGDVPPFEGLRAVHPGDTTGPLAGGNLCVLSSLVGTPWAPRLRDHLVLLEDVGEPAYKVDRMLSQLRLSGALDGIRGLLFGDFTGVEPAEGARIDELLAQLARQLGVPAAAGLPLGHGARNAPLPFGASHQAHLTVRTHTAHLSVTARR